MQRKKESRIRRLLSFYFRKLILQFPSLKYVALILPRYTIAVGCEHPTRTMEVTWRGVNVRTALYRGKPRSCTTCTLLFVAPCVLCGGFIFPGEYARSVSLRRNEARHKNAREVAVSRFLGCLREKCLSHHPETETLGMWVERIPAKGRVVPCYRPIHVIGNSDMRIVSGEDIFPHTYSEAQTELLKERIYRHNPILLTQQAS